MRNLGIVAAWLLAGCRGSGTPSPLEKPKPDVVEAPEAAPLVPPERPPVDPGALTWDDDYAMIDPSYGFLVDGDRAVWADSNGVIRAAPLAGGAATVLASFSVVNTIATRDGVVYASADGALWSIAADGTITGLARAYANHISVSDDTIYLGDFGGLEAIPRDGGEPVTLVADPGDLSSITATSTHVFWTDGGDPDSGRFGAVKRVAVGGGRIVSRAAFYPRSLTIAGGLVYWADEGDGAAIHAGLDGNGVAVVIAGRGQSLAIDDASTVVLTGGGMVVELSPDGVPWVKSLIETTSAGEVELSDDTIYVVGDAQIHRLPRGPSGTTLLAVPDARIVDVAVSGSDVYYIDARADQADRVMRVPAAGGDPVMVREVEGAIEQLTVVGERVITYDREASVLAVDGVPIATEVFANAIAADTTKVYWLEQRRISATTYAGKREVVWEPPAVALGGDAGGMGWSGDTPPPGMLTVTGRAIVAGSLTLPGVVRVPLGTKKGKKKGRAEVIATGAWQGTASGDRTLAWTDQGLELHPGGTVLLAPGRDEEAYGIGGLIADDRDAYVLEYASLRRVPLDGSPPEELLLAGAGELALTPDALYLAAPGQDALLKIAR